MMQITPQRLIQIIKEEIQKANLNEGLTPTEAIEELKRLCAAGNEKATNAYHVKSFNGWGQHGKHPMWPTFHRYFTSKKCNPDLAGGPPREGEGADLEEEFEFDLEEDIFQER